MNRTEHLLTILCEECVEVTKEATKALRFGLDDHAPGTLETETNRKKLRNEILDVLAVAEMLANDEIIDPASTECDALIDLKIAKVEKYLEYSKTKGTLA